MKCTKCEAEVERTFPLMHTKGGGQILDTREELCARCYQRATGFDVGEFFSGKKTILGPDGKPQ